MAQWHERDERWLVEERPDGKNVNGWHWEERSCLEDCKRRLSEMLPGTRAADLGEEVGTVSVTSVKEVTGEASVTTRKGGKKAVIYDLHITVEWEGKLTAHPDKVVTGELKVEEIVAGLEPDDWIVSVTAPGSGKAVEACRKAADGLRSPVRRALEQFVAELCSAA